MDRTDQDDKQFKRNADECVRLGIPFGVYLYSYADTEQKAKSEAQHALRLVDGYPLQYPIYYDLEEAGTESGVVNRAKIFCDAIEGAGHWAGIYCNKSWWDNYLSGLGDRYTKWIARYNNVLGMDGVDMWQYTSDGSVSGIAGRVDMNHCYRDFPAEITGGTTPTEPPAQAAPSGSLLELVAGTMQGEFGDGEVRKAELGNRYQEVQDMINHIHTAPLQVLVDETLAGKYGNGEIRKIVLGDRYEEVQNRINAGAFDLTGWVRRLQTACNQQGFSDQTVDGKTGEAYAGGLPHRAGGGFRGNHEADSGTADFSWLFLRGCRGGWEIREGYKSRGSGAPEGERVKRLTGLWGKIPGGSCLDCKGSSLLR